MSLTFPCDNTFAWRGGNKHPRTYNHLNSLSETPHRQTNLRGGKDEQVGRKVLVNVDLEHLAHHHVAPFDRRRRAAGSRQNLCAWPEFRLRVGSTSKKKKKKKKNAAVWQRQPRRDDTGCNTRSGPSWHTFGHQNNGEGAQQQKENANSRLMSTPLPFQTTTLLPTPPPKKAKTKHQAAKETKSKHHTSKKADR